MPNKITRTYTEIFADTIGHLFGFTTVAAGGATIATTTIAASVTACVTVTATATTYNQFNKPENKIDPYVRSAEAITYIGNKGIQIFGYTNSMLFSFGHAVGYTPVKIVAKMVASSYEQIKSLTTIKQHGKTIISLLGDAGSGKGTQGDYLSKKTCLPTISIGDLLRTEKRKNTPLGKLIQKYDKEFLPDEIFLNVLSKRLSQTDCSKGYILDGFPRTEKQAQTLLNSIMCPEDHYVAIYMDISTDVIKQRIQNRYICNACGEQARGITNNTSSACIKEGCIDGKLERRIEDQDEVQLNRRFNRFKQNIDGVIKIIEQHGRVFHMNLNGSEQPLDIAQSINDMVLERTLVQKSSLDANKLAGKF